MKPTMKTVRIRKLSGSAWAIERCQVAESFIERLRGLIGRKSFEAGEGMLFPRCNDIHMWFMSIPIDVVFLRKEGSTLQVCSTRENLRPWRALPVRDSKATDTLELPSGTVRQLGISAGDVLCFD